MKKFPCLKVMMLATLLALLLTGASFAEKLTINDSFPDGRVGIPYKKLLYLTGYHVIGYSRVTEHPAHHRWMITEGTIPPGLSFRTAELGLEVGYDDWRADVKAGLDGTPTKAGIYTFTVYAYESSEPGYNAEKTFTIKINDTSNNNGNTGNNTGGNDNSTTNRDQTSINNNTGDNNTTDNNTNTNGNTNNDGTTNNNGNSGSSGGGCNSLSALAIIFAVALTLRKSRA